MLKWVVSGHQTHSGVMAGNVVLNPLYHEEMSSGMPVERNTTTFWVSQPKQMNKRLSRSLDNLLGDEDDAVEGGRCVNNKNKRGGKTDWNNNRKNKIDNNSCVGAKYVTTVDVMNVSDSVSGDSAETQSDRSSKESDKTSQSSSSDLDLWETRSLDVDFFSFWKMPHQFLRVSRATFHLFYKYRK